MHTYNPDLSIQDNIEVKKRSGNKPNEKFWALTWSETSAMFQNKNNTKRATFKIFILRFLVTGLLKIWYLNENSARKWAILGEFRRIRAYCVKSNKRLVYAAAVWTITSNWLVPIISLDFSSAAKIMNIDENFVSLEFPVANCLLLFCL